MYTAANAARMVIDRGTASALELINNAKRFEHTTHTLFYSKCHFFRVVVIRKTVCLGLLIIQKQ